MKKTKQKKIVWLNGTKGAVALFMALIMTPFLTSILIIVETGRYNSAVSILDEAMGVSAVSTLANYDEYLQERWGLLALSQEIETEKLYSDNLKINAGVMGNILEINSVSAQGQYALSDSDILYNQIMEYCKLNAPVGLAENFLNLSSLLSSFDTIKNLQSLASIFTSGANAVDSAIDLHSSSSELKECANELDSLKSKYDNAYTEFETATNHLITALEEERPDEKEDPDGAAEYDENIRVLRETAKNKQMEYEEIIEEISSNLTQFQSSMKTSTTSMTNIGKEVTNAASELVAWESRRVEKESDLEKINKNISEMEAQGVEESNPNYIAALNNRNAIEEELAQLKLEEGSAKALKEGYSTTIAYWNDSFDTYSDDTIQVVIEAFDELKITVQSLDMEMIDKDTEKIDRDTYQTVAVSGYIEADKIDAYLQEQEEEMVAGSWYSFVKGMQAFLASMCKLDLFYNSNLTAYIDVDYYQSVLGGLPGQEGAYGGVLAIVTEIGNVIADVESIVSAISSLDFLEMLGKVKSLLTHLAQVFIEIGEFALGVIENITSCLDSYERMYYSTYVAFNLPCRTNYSSGTLSFKTMTGYSMDATSLPMKRNSDLASNIPVIRNFAAGITAINQANEGTGSDLTFCGAELEYILFGSNSEVANQLYTFWALYLLRLLLDYIPIQCNAEVQSMALASTIAYAAVIGIELLLEPFVDTVLLVNGSDVPMYETTIYLTPSGLPSLIEKLFSVCRMSSEDKAEIKSNLLEAFDASEETYDAAESAIKEANSTSQTNSDQSAFEKGITKWANGLLSFNYREYCFMLLLLTVTEEQQMARLSNLIQMETLYHYQDEEVGYIFNLDKSYTFLSTDVNVSVKQLLPTLLDSSLFDIERKQYRGY